MLTNRSTHQRRVKAATSSLFTESSYQSRLDNLTSSVPENLQAGIGMILRNIAAENISEDEKLKRAKVIVRLSQHADIQSLVNKTMNDEQACQEQSEFIAKRMSELEHDLKVQAEQEPASWCISQKLLEVQH